MCGGCTEYCRSATTGILQTLYSLHSQDEEANYDKAFLSPAVREEPKGTEHVSVLMGNTEGRNNEIAQGLKLVT